MGNLGGNPSAGGWKPPSGDQHPPCNGSSTNRIGGVHSPGSSSSSPRENNTQTTSMSDAVIRNQGGNAPPRK